MPSNRTRRCGLCPLRWRCQIPHSRSCWWFLAIESQNAIPVWGFPVSRSGNVHPHPDLASDRKQTVWTRQHIHHDWCDYVNPGCGRSRCSRDLEVSIAPGRRAKILIAVTAGGYCAWLACARVAATRAAAERQARHQHNPTLLSEATRIRTRFLPVNCMPGTHFIELFVFVSFADPEHIFRQLS